MSRPLVVALLSGGVDSTTLVFSLIADGYDVLALSVDYGQRHRTELDHAHRIAHGLTNVTLHEVLDLSSLKRLLARGSLTGGTPVPHGKYDAPSMTATVVPNRNAILLTIAYGVAVAHSAVKVATAVHAGDHAIYPDCRPEFIKALDDMERVALDREIYGSPPPQLYAPFVMMTKRQIAELGEELGVPWAATWSCYEGGETHCGRCGTCVERLEALDGLNDETVYRDSEFWKTVIDA